MELQNTEVSAGKIGVINGFRALAIIGVVLHHLVGGRVDPAMSAMQVGPLPFFPTFPLTNGYAGVALFFMLSGFVLALPFLQGRRTMRSLDDVREFYVRRLRRLGPLYVLIVLLCGIFVYPHALLSGIPLMMTMAFSFSHSTFFPPYNWVLWSLAVEVFFSFSLPLVLVAIRRFGIRRVFLCSLTLSASVMMLSGAFTWLYPIANGFPGRFSDFVYGVLLAYLFVHHKERPSRCSLYVGVIVLVAAFQLSDLATALNNLHPERVMAVRLLYSLALMIVNLGFFLCIDALLRGRHVFLTWCLEFGPLQMIGLMSYSIYVWHGVMIHPLAAQSDAVHVVRYLVMLFAISVVTYRFVEFGNITNFRMLLPSARTVRFPLASWFRTRETSHVHTPS